MKWLLKASVTISHALQLHVMSFYPLHDPTVKNKTKNRISRICVVFLWSVFIEQSFNVTGHLKKNNRQIKLSVQQPLCRNIFFFSTFLQNTVELQQQQQNFSTN